MLQRNWTNMLQFQGTTEKSPRVCKHEICAEICICFRHDFVASIRFDRVAWKASHVMWWVCPVKIQLEASVSVFARTIACGSPTGQNLIPRLCPQTTASSRGAASQSRPASLLQAHCQSSVIYSHFLHLGGEGYVFPWFTSLR